MVIDLCDSSVPIAGPRCLICSGCVLGLTFLPILVFFVLYSFCPVMEKARWKRNYFHSFSNVYSPSPTGRWRTVCSIGPSHYLAGWCVSFRETRIIIFLYFVSFFVAASVPSHLHSSHQFFIIGRAHRGWAPLVIEWMSSLERSWLYMGTSCLIKTIVGWSVRGWLFWGY